MTTYQKKLVNLLSTCYSNKKQIKAVIGIRNYINSNYASELNLESLAEARYISKFHLLRLFKKYYGLTPKQYLIDLRIEKSKGLLENNLSVSETCYSVGFESIGSFSTLFKTKTGKSPSAYQKEQLSINKSEEEFRSCLLQQTR